MKQKHLLFLVSLLLVCTSALGQREISGTVSGQDGSPLIGATVVATGTTTGVITDQNGRYSISAPASAKSLRISYIGYIDQEIPISTSSVINVTMEETVKQLNEVVITALGVTQEKKALGYAVSEINGGDLNVARETNALNALQGRVAGVEINQGASGPAGATRVVIRGSSSLTGNNQPLYVIDGVVIDNSVLGAAGAWGGRDFGDGISNINPDDIESVSVLKGPNAAALYGQRGANGVILINTKTGAGTGKTQVNFSTNYVLGTPAVLPEFQNTYGQGLNGQFTHLRLSDGSIVANDGSATGTPQGFPAPTGGAPEGPPSWGPQMTGQQYIDVFGDTRTFTAQPNNLADFLQNQQTWTNTLSIKGSSDNINYNFTGSYLDNEGMLPTNTLKRYNATMRVGGKIMEKLSFDSKITYIRQESVNRPNLADEQQNVMYALRYIPRDVPLSSLEQYEIGADELDKLVGLSGGALTPGYERHWSSGTFTGNPYWSVNNTHNEDSRNRAIGFAKLTYEFTDWLNLSARIGNDVYSDQILQWQDKGTRVGPNGDISEVLTTVRETNADFLLSANKKLGSDFGISFNFGGNAQEFSRRGVGHSGNTFNTQGFPVITNTKNRGTSFALSESRINSLYGFGNFSYRDAIYLNWTARNDWSSTLSPDNWSFFYPSLSLSVVLSELVDMPEAITFLKLRGSWAQAGASGNPYQIFGTYGLAGNPFNGQTMANFTNRIPFADLQNELSESVEVGLELSLFDNRVALDFTYYDQSTRNQILSAGVSTASGFSSQLINAGEIANSGIEFLLSGSIFRNPKGLNWDISFNAGINNSKIVSLSEGIERFQTGGADRNVDMFVDIGESFGNLYSRNYYAKDDAGNILVDGSTGLPIRVAGRELIGNAIPDWIGGIRNSLSFKGVNLSFLIDISQGAEIYSQSNMYMTLYGTGAWTEANREGGLVVDGFVGQQDGNGDWTSTGTKNTTAVTAQEYWLNAVPGSTTAIAEEFVYDGSYVALREVILGYNFPSSLMEKLPLRSLRISLVGRNLGYFEKHIPGVAPEAYIFNRNTVGASLGLESMSFPIARTFGIDLNLGF